MLNPVLAFALTAFVIEITPGPNMTYLAALSLSNGMRTGFAAVAGIALENEQDRAYGLKRYMAETRRLYGVLDRRLANHEFVAGPLSVADFAILGWAWRHPRHKVELSDFPNVKHWYDQLMARPAVKRGMEAKLD